MSERLMIARIDFPPSRFDDVWPRLLFLIAIVPGAKLVRLRELGRGKTA
jgi:hypothetical protein